MNRDFDVLVAGYYGFGNLGDELLAKAVCYLLRKGGVPPEKIAYLSASPEATSSELGVNAFNRWRVDSVYKVMKRSRSLLFGGGGLFQDVTGLLTPLYYCGLVRLAKLCGTVPWLFGQSVGPLNGRIAVKLAKNAFASCSYIGVRDHNSLKKVTEWGLKAEFSPDLAIVLPVKKVSSYGRTLIFNARPGYECLSRLAAECALMTAESRNLTIRALAFDSGDERELNGYRAFLGERLEGVIRIRSLSDFERAVEGGCLALGMRMHFLILSVLSSLPVCAVPYDPKVTAFAREWKVPLAETHEIKFSTPCSGGAGAEAASNVESSFLHELKCIIGENNG